MEGFTDAEKSCWKVKLTKSNLEWELKDAFFSQMDVEWLTSAKNDKFSVSFSYKNQRDLAHDSQGSTKKSMNWKNDFKELQEKEVWRSHYDDEGIRT